MTLTLAAGNSVPVLRYTQRCKGPPWDSLLFEPQHLGEGVTLFCKTPETAMAWIPAVLTLHPTPKKTELECVTRPDSQGVLMVVLGGVDTELKMNRSGRSIARPLHPVSLHLHSRSVRKARAQP